MKERPILMSAPMVRAILDGRKTQTRRISKCHEGGGRRYFDDHERTSPRLDFSRHSYGAPGDRLWVKETWRPGWSYGGEYPTVQYRSTETAHIGDKDSPVMETEGIFGGAPHAIINGGKWKSPIFMPRWASRILLEVTAVRVERLKSITVSDAMAEGYDGSIDDPLDPSIKWYSALWEQINGAGSWDENPWVWVIEFRRIDHA